MARYTTQGEEVLPSHGGQIITHHVNIFEEADAAALQLAINDFFEHLRLVEDKYPIIKDVEYQIIQTEVTPMVVNVYTALVWFILSA